MSLNMASWEIPEVHGKKHGTKNGGFLANHVRLSEGNYVDRAWHGMPPAMMEHEWLNMLKSVL